MRPARDDEPHQLYEKSAVDRDRLGDSVVRKERKGLHGASPRRKDNRVERSDEPRPIQVGELGQT